MLPAFLEELQLAHPSDHGWEVRIFPFSLLEPLSVPIYFVYCLSNVSFSLSAQEGGHCRALEAVKLEECSQASYQWSPV